MVRYLAAYGAVLVSFLAIDMIWLLVIARAFYRSRIGALMAAEPQLAPAAAFYALIALGLVIFAVAPALREGSWRAALTNGLMFGFFAYATYDLTNLATLRDWSMSLSIVDMVWGAVLSGICATIGYVAASALQA